MSGWQHRFGTATALASANRIYELGELIVESDNAGTSSPLKYKWGDGIQTYTVLPYAGTGGGGGGGPASPPAITQLGTGGTLGSTVTLPSPNEGDLQVGTLTANLVITPPASPGSGLTQSFKVKLIQGGGSGGYTWGFASSAAFPAGVQIPLTSLAAVNWLELVWDGTSWNIFPATAGATVVTCTALDVLGGLSGRFMGFQNTGAAPTQSSPQTNDFWLDTDGTPSFWLWNGTGWANFGGAGGGGSGITVSSPFTFSMPADSGSGLWVPVTPKYYDITQAPFNVATTGDNTFLINNAMFQLSQRGIVPWLPPHATPYPCTTQGLLGIIAGVVQPVPTGTSGAWAPGGVILFSNGVPNGTVISGTTFTNGQDATYISQLEGGYPTVGNGKASKPINAPINETVIQWAGGTGYSGSLVMALGPTSSGGAKNIRFDGNSSYAKGPLTSMTVLSARSMKWPGVSISSCINGLFCTTVQCTSANATNCVDNDFDDLFVQYTGQSSPPNPNGSTAAYSYGVLLGYDGHVGGNSCYNRFDHLNVIGGSTNASGHSSPICYGMVFQGCDSNTVDFADISAGACTVPIVMDYSASNGGQWPAGNTMTVVETGGINTTAEGGAAAKNIGSPSGSYANSVLRVSQVNGYAPNPNLVNLIWDTPGIKGTAQLVAGQVTLPGFGPEFANAFGGGGNGSIRAWYIAAGGTLGAYFASSYSGSTLTLSSMTSGGSVNTADTSLVGWELVP